MRENMEPTINTVVWEFSDWWKSGGRIKLDGNQLTILRIFYDWLKEREAKPPDLGVSVSESIGIKDSMVDREQLRG